MITIENTALVIIDVQGKLATLVHKYEELFHQLVVMAKGARELELPIIWVEHLPEKLGQTVEPLSNVLEGLQAIRKSSFSCVGEPAFVMALEETKCRQVLLMGIEAHICVYQTAQDLLDVGYDVEVLVDAVSSRTIQNKNIAIDKMSAIGVGLSSVEMALFELMKTTEDPQFRSIFSLIK